MAGPPRLVVAAECPSCGAPLDFTEGATTALCAHCNSRLLLTGRGRVLAFHVGPRVDAPRALTIARGVAPRVSETRLYFLPYYRFTGQELCWETESNGDDGSEPPDPQPLTLEERQIERNFLASAWDGLNLCSLGVRPGTLKLSLFRREALGDGHVVGVETAPDVALARALRPIDTGPVVHRAVLGGMLSLIYYPYWVGFGAERLALIDAVSGTVTAADASPSWRERFERPENTARATVEFRPLVCPNCGWDLPAEGGLVLFYCTECSRAWQVTSDRLESIPATVAAVPPGTEREQQPLRRLPVWLVQVDANGTLPAQVIVPAFHYRGQKLMLALATRLTRKAPAFEAGDAQGQMLEGGHLDRDDAVALARFIVTGITGAPAPAFDVRSVTLAWLPFASGAGSLRELQTGFALPVGGLG